jgi:hypothetical protein
MLAPIHQHPGRSFDFRELAIPRQQVGAMMPILPLDHPEPFAATLGVMLYPDEADTPKARAYAA